jgi:hypothetical protein
VRSPVLPAEGPGFDRADVAYVGNHGVDTVAQPNINAGLIIGAGTLGQPEYPRTASTTCQDSAFSRQVAMYTAKHVGRWSTRLRAYGRRMQAWMLYWSCFALSSLPGVHRCRFCRLDDGRVSTISSISRCQ